jgi:AraC-like DNA-binding protein
MLFLPCWQYDMSDHWLDLIAPVLNIAGADPGRADWLDPKRIIYDHELLLMGAGGRFLYELVDESGRTVIHECNGPAFLIIPPGVWHTCKGVVSVGIRRGWLHFDWTTGERRHDAPILTYWPGPPLEYLFRYPPSFVPRRILRGAIPNETLAFEILARAAERFNQGTPRMQATARALLLELLLYLLSDGPGASSPTPGSEEHLVKIRSALDDLSQMPFSSAASVRDALTGLGMSYDHQARMFRRAYGVTPLQYLGSKRIERAKKLLRDTTDPVAAIASRMGFADAVYFHRFFRKLAGMTPGEYRRSD